MSRAIASVKENKQASNVVKTNVSRYDLSSSSLVSPKLPLVTRLQGLTGTTKPLVQPKLKIGAANDKYEQEADRVADQVMRMPDVLVDGSKSQIFNVSTGDYLQRSCAGCHEELDDDVTVRAKTMSSHTATVTPNILNGINSLKGGGKPLSESTRNYFEPRFGHDFSQVKVHSDNHAAGLANGINAKAFTMGQDVFFGNGQYQPSSKEGQRLIAHELVHIVQQTNCRGSAQIQRTPDLEKTGANRLPSLPKPLQKVLLRSYIRGDLQLCSISDKDKSTLTNMENMRKLAHCYNYKVEAEKRSAILNIYTQLTALGLWKYVDVLRGAWSVGASFRISGSASKMRQDLMRNKNMCLETGIGNFLHRPAMAFRQVSSTSSLHVLIYGGGLFSAHIDKTSPVAGRNQRGDCVHHTQRALRHIGTEVVPKHKLNFLNLQVFPHQTHVPAERSQVLGARPADLPPSLVGWSWKF